METYIWKPWLYTLSCNMQNSCSSSQEICFFIFRLLHLFVSYNLIIYSVTSFSGESGEAPEWWWKGIHEAELSPMLDQDGHVFFYRIIQIFYRLQPERSVTRVLEVVLWVLLLLETETFWDKIGLNKCPETAAERIEAVIFRTFQVNVLVQIYGFYH